MLHVYRQITSLRRVRPVVIAQKREHADLFPFEPVRVVPKSSWHFLRRIWCKQITDRPWQISRSEVRALENALADARLLHIYFGHIAVLLRPLIERWPRPAIVSFHGADVGVDLQKPTHREATRVMLGAVSRILVRSDSLRRSLIELGAPPEKIEMQRTGIPLAEFALRERATPANGQWRLLQAGRLIEKKGIATSLRAFAAFRKIYPTATFTIAGDGPLRAELENLAHELQIGSAVIFLGFVSQGKLRELLYESHLFLHPSAVGRDGNQEGVPNAMLEAMASGLPVFATRHGGIPEAIIDGESGRLVAEGDDRMLADALIVAAQAPETLRAMGKRASETVARDFGQAEQTRRLEEIYLREIASSRA
ncbi:MAG: glycosyltransferase [Verrucomicrobiota bacterium]|nr:glycosyltransferase [Verrucomicrobiota bacterium]